MNPYSRFGLVSNTASAAALLSLLAIIGPDLIQSVESRGLQSISETWTVIGGLVAVMVVVWIAMTEAIFPSLFRLNVVRRLVLGKYYFEGTWLQSEKGEAHNRLSVIDIQPSGKSFIFSGYSLNENLEIESNTLIEFSKLEWPFMTYKYRNSLSDGADGRRDGVGEIQFEMNRATSRRYNGFVQYVRYENRVRIEGAKLTSNSEVRSLRTLQGRQKVFQKYWDLFFNTSIYVEKIRRQNTAAVAAVASQKRPEVNEMPSREPDYVSPTRAAPPESAATHPPVITQTSDSAAVAAPTVERRATVAPKRRRPASDAVVPRRRATDWERDALNTGESFKGAPLEKVDTSAK